MILSTVGDMIRGQALLALPPEATIREAAERMRERHVGSVLVTDAAGTLLGIFTERDAICRVLAPGRDPTRMTMAEAMTQRPEAVGPEALPTDALRLMRDGHYRHVPVVDGAGKAIGMVAFSDFRDLDLVALQRRLEDEDGLVETLR